MNKITQIKLYVKGCENLYLNISSEGRARTFSTMLESAVYMKSEYASNTIDFDLLLTRSSAKSTTALITDPVVEVSSSTESEFKAVIFRRVLNDTHSRGEKTPAGCTEKFNADARPPHAVKF